jgi:hypothetical protein
MARPEDALAELARSWPGHGWTWDGRFGTVASTFGPAVHKQARAALALALPSQWTSETLDRAPEPLRKICSATGGLRATQLLFGGPSFGGVTPYGLWWPWSDGQTLTLRLGFDGADAAMLAKLRAQFGVPG